MTYDELSAEQKADLATMDSALRALFVAMAKAAATANPVALQAFSASRVAPILAELESKDLVPNSTGYAGARPLTVTEFNKMRELANQLLSQYSTNIVLLQKIAGVNAG